jgi:hypothetical protein
MLGAHLERAFPGLAGAVTALPVVVAPGRPLEFREWHPGVTLAPGPLGIPNPAGSDPIVPTVALIPMVGRDEAGYRLGYGAGYFDRTLQGSPRPIAIGIGYELARMKARRPYRRDPGGLVFLDEPPPDRPSRPASPVCYADEVDPGYWRSGSPDPPAR